MSEKICPFTPLHYRTFVQKTYYECDGRVAVGDLNCGNTIDVHVPQGTYVGYDENHEEQWCGVAFVLKQAQEAFEKGKLSVEQSERYVYRDWFGVDSATCVVLFSRLHEYMDASDINYQDNWPSYGWVGFTAYGDGGYPVNRIVNGSGEVVGFRVDFVGLSEHEYLRMCEEGLIDFDDEFFLEYFATGW